MQLPPWNAEMIGVWGIYAFTAVEAVVLRNQILKIWRERSGASIPVGNTMFVVALCCSAVIYGLTHNRPPIAINGFVVGLGFGIIAVGLWCFKGFQRWEWWFGGLLVLSLFGMLLTGHHDRWYCGYSILSAATLILQPWEIWHNKSTGVVNIGLLLAFEASNIFWLIYGYTVRDWVLMLTSPIFTVIISFTILLWWIYRPQTTAKAQLQTQPPRH